MPARRGNHAAGGAGQGMALMASPAAAASSKAWPDATGGVDVAEWLSGSLLASVGWPRVAQAAGRRPRSGLHL